MGTKQDRRTFLKIGATYGTGLVIGCSSLSGCANLTKTDATTKKEKKMNEIIAYCGLSCHSCAIYLATREQDPKKKREMRVDIAKQIKEHYGQECKPEDVTDCDGCKTETGRLNSGSKNCHIRKCARQKGLENCAHCNEYPCEELEKLFTTDPDAEKRLNVIRSEL
jgi:hypothetical protein